MPTKANHDTDRESILRFDEIINIGKAMSGDFERLGFKLPRDLIGKDPVQMYRESVQSINNSMIHAFSIRTWQRSTS